MTTINQQNMGTIKKLFEEVYNKGNLSALDELMESNVKLTDPASPNQGNGIRAIKELQRKYMTAFPGQKLKIDEIFSSDDRVAVRWTMTGVQKGELQDIPASNQQVKVSGISLYRLTNGKITEIHQQWDRLSLLEQIGEVQPAHALH